MSLKMGKLVQFNSTEPSLTGSVDKCVSMAVSGGALFGGKSTLCT